MTTKVVINGKSGNEEYPSYFELSQIAKVRLEELGYSCLEYHHLQRHDWRLIQVVEELGKTANGHRCQLIVEEIEGNIYRINVHDDGYEELQELDDLEWVNV